MVQEVKLYNPHKLFTKSAHSPTGDGYEHYEEEVIDPKTGEIKTKKKKVWIYGLIQEARKTCDMEYILSQIAKGNTSVLQESNGVFMDSRDLPQDVQEAQDLKDQAASLYKENKELQALYKTEADYEKALFGGVDIASEIIKKRIEAAQKLTPKEEVKPNVNDKVKPNGEVASNLDPIKENK